MHRGVQRSLVWVVCVWVVVCFGPLVGLAQVGGGGLPRLDWALYPNGCEVSASQLELACGALGSYHFEGDLTSSNCSPLASGSGIPKAFPGPQDVPDIVQPFPKPGNGAGGGGNGASRSAGAFFSPPGQEDGGPESLVPRVAAIDFAHELHGEFVRDFIGQLAGGEAQVDLVELEEAPLLFGSTVSDAHLLHALCRVADGFEVAPVQVVNMSLGRHAEPDDPQSLPGDCPQYPAPGKLACEVLRVIEDLRLQQEVTFVAASGNHGKTLFPAIAADVMSVATIDVSYYVTSLESEDLWEGPGVFDAVFPGHALCLGDVPLPAGSSFASALFAGWLSNTLVDPDAGSIDPYLGGWNIDWSKEKLCWTLSQHGVSVGECNLGFDLAILGVVTGGEAGCWDPVEESSRQVVTTASLGIPQPQPQLPSLDEFVASQHSPAPEPDPCIPCLGGNGQNQLHNLGGGSDLVVSMTASPDLAVGYHLRALYLRIDDQFYPLGLSEEDLDLVESGGVSGLSIPGYDLGVHASSRQMSIFYMVSEDDDADCEREPETCFWGSSPLLSYYQQPDES